MARKRSYTAKYGDTWESIANQLRVPINTLLKGNKQNRPVAGSVINIPNPLGNNLPTPERPLTWTPSRPSASVMTENRNYVSNVYTEPSLFPQDITPMPPQQSLMEGTTTEGPPPPGDWTDNPDRSAPPAGTRPARTGPYPGDTDDRYAWNPDDDTFYRWDPVTNTWIKAPRLPGYKRGGNDGGDPRRRGGRGGGGGGQPPAPERPIASPGPPQTYTPRGGGRGNLQGPPMSTYKYRGPVSPTPSQTYVSPTGRITNPRAFGAINWRY